MNRRLPIFFQTSKYDHIAGSKESIQQMLMWFMLKYDSIYRLKEQMLKFDLNTSKSLTQQSVYMFK